MIKHVQDKFQNIRAQQGLRILLTETDRDDAQPEFKLDSHPFGLPWPIDPQKEDREDLTAKYPPKILFLGFPRYVKSGADDLVACVREHISCCGSQCARVVYVREIYVPQNSQGSSNSDFSSVYFEVGFLHQVVMCGGCTTSGPGTGNREVLESLFELLVLITNIDIQRTFLMYPEGRMLEQRLNERLEKMSEE